MTREELEALGRRAVACKHWRWMPGMRSLSTDGTGRGWRRVVASRPTIGTSCVLESGRRLRQPTGEATHIPDLSDPATLGCLLALVREAWGDRYISTIYHEHQVGFDANDYPLTEMGWFVCSESSDLFDNATEAGALVAALEAAP